MGYGGGWGRGQALTGARVDGEGLRGAGAPLQAVLEAVRWVVAVSAGHAPHGAAESRRLQHGEGGTIGACRCEFVDGRHRHEHGHAGCVAHGGSATLAPPCSLHRAGCALPWTGWGARGRWHHPWGRCLWGSRGGMFPQPAGFGVGKGFSHLPHDLPHCTPPQAPPGDTGTHCFVGAALPPSPRWWP